MTQTLNATCQIQMLDRGYSKETRALLYQAYLHDPTFRYVFEAHRKGYAQRVRATVRALVKQHFFQQLPALGLLVDDRLIGVALIAPPQRRLGITESWAWQLRMIITAGLRGTQRYLQYHQAVLACVPGDAVHMLPLLAVDPQFQDATYPEQLLEAVHNWCAVDEHSEGVVLDSSNPRYQAFYKRHGYVEIGEVALGAVVEHVFFHAKPQVLHAATA
ncbi:GNAT family N-acetyltransferase [Pseudomonas sp. SIMBA_077]